ncbi:hypothetical protein Ndes2526B_g07497 [Nannochloris sp. 'desiccata']|nr:hypothetical protein KSW81_001244 [Chlorella desiccata (nom. nud.)]KAH7617633.1 putative UPF0301 protein [Chlorella desiccata (nom. nud.)]
MAQVVASNIFYLRNAAATVGRKPASRRSLCVVRAQFGDNRDPNEAQRNFNGNDIPRFFAVDGNPPALEQDWRLFRAQLVAHEIGNAVPASGAGLEMLVRPADSWAHPIPHPEPGCLLVARHSNLGMFSHSVVLVTEHDDTAGTSALVLNMPTPLYISNLGLEEDITSSFGHSPLFIGGPMTRSLLHVLHGRGDVDSAMQIIDGVYAGGVESASKLVELGLARPEEFRLLAGYSGWGPYQLEREIESGSWWVVAASHTLILDCLRETAALNPAKSSVVNGRATSITSSGVAGGSRAQDDVKFRCWKKVLDAAGIQH